MNTPTGALATTTDTAPASAELPLRNLVYCSRAADGVGDATVQQIVATARRINPARGITGLLVYGDALFFQWLEGPTAAVQELLQRLAQDPRHHSLVVLSQSDEVRERLFPDWSMELVGTDTIREVLQDALGEAQDSATQATLQAMLDGLQAEGL